MRKLLRETVRLRITGAEPLRCLNRWSADGLAFWAVERESEWGVLCSAYAAELSALERDARRAQCELTLLRRAGLPLLLRRLRGRPALMLGLPLVFALLFFLQQFVWFVQIAGNERIPEAVLRNVLEEEGVCFGAWGPSLNSEMLKNRMLNRIPELRWLAVNREGGVVTVLTAERPEEEPPLEQGGVAHLVAMRPGVIRELRVINGFTDLKVGDPVQAGDILISGLMEWSTHVQATRAMGEVYADTFRAETLICPDSALEKLYTGRTERCVTIIFQRNRRKLSGNSSIFGTMCDRMIETTDWTLPGGFRLPFRLETETLREYSLQPRSLSKQDAETIMTCEALRLTQARMIAGQIKAGTTTIQKKANSYLCRTAMNCVEMIAKTVPAELFGEEAENGKAHQRGAD